MSNAANTFPLDATRVRRIMAYLTLILAAGTIYFLPYMRQSYHNTMLATFGITNTQLGLLNSAFGITAMICYLPSGWLADRFSPRKLLTFSLLSTGLSGLYFATFPPYGALVGIHIVWGVSTILTFWAAVIKAVRSCGQPENQGRIFGGFEGGRGLVEGAVASLALVAFVRVGEGPRGLAAVVVLYSVAALVAGACVWFFSDDDMGPSVVARRTTPSWETMARIARMPVAWLLAVVVLSAYAAYWGTYDIAVFAEDGFGVSAESSARLSTFRMWFRALAPIVAGLVADRLSSSRAVTHAFWVMAASFGAFVLLPTDSSLLALLWMNTAVAALAVFTLRGVYFALLQEGRVPTGVTGLVVGAVSLIGFTPDAWSPLLVGWLLDTYPGALGHRYYFAFLAVLCLVGALAAHGVGRLGRRPQVVGQRWGERAAAHRGRS